MTAGTVHSEVSPEIPVGCSDREALLREIVHTHRSVLIAYTIRLTGGDRDWAEDVVQETFVKAWRHVERLTAARGSVRGWLLRVAHNLVVDGYRAARSRPAQVEIDGAPPVPVTDNTEDVLTAIVLREALDTLPTEHRAALVETYLRDRTAVQASAALGIPVGTVKSRAYYGLRRLRSVIDRAALAG